MYPRLIRRKLLNAFCVSHSTRYTTRSRDVDYHFHPETREPYLIKTYGESLERPTPFPYEKKWYGFWAKLFDKTMWRLDRNSKIILVEGGLASGKTAVAKQLAHDFDLKFFPSPTPDDIFAMQSGLDLRELNHMLPRRIRHYDFKAFFTDPEPEKKMIGLTQFHMFRRRFHTYAKAMLHLLSTGQGVVLERAVQADIIFAHVLYKLGYLSHEGLDHYWDLYKRALVEFLPPHLTVYLDSPVSKTKERIKQRNIPWEVNSQTLNDEFLEAYNYYAENVFLAELSRTGETLIVDASEDVKPEDITEDVGNIDLETKDHDHFTKFDLWTFTSEHELSRFRHKAQDPFILSQLSFVKPMWDAPELIFTTAESVIYQETVKKHPLITWKRGYEEENVPLWQLMFLRP